MLGIKILWSRTMFYHIQYRVQLNTIYKKQSQKKKNPCEREKRPREKLRKEMYIIAMFQEKLTHRWQN